MKYYILSDDNMFSYVMEQNSKDFEKILHLVNYTTSKPPTSEPDTWRWSGRNWIKVLKPKPVLGFSTTTNNLSYNSIKSEYTGELISYEGDRRINNVPS